MRKDGGGSAANGGILFNLPGCTFRQTQSSIRMFKKFTLTDRLLFVAAFLTIIVSKLTYLFGEKNDAIFVGIWAPSILAFGIYLKLIGDSKNG